MKPHKAHGGRRAAGAPIFLEQGKVIAREVFDEGQYVLKIDAPRIAETAGPGQFVHLRCDDDLPLRRPYSIMGAANGAVEILFKLVGEGSRRLAMKSRGDELSCLGPVGNRFELHPQRPDLLLVGGGVGIPPIVFLAHHARAGAGYRPLVLIGSEAPFPFATTASEIAVGGCGDDVHMTMAALEQAGVPARLASKRGFAGCYNGWLDGLAEQWLNASGGAHRRIEIFACGPPAMLKSIARLAAQFDLPCQVAVEEYMACAVGGCAGCTVAVMEAGKPTMKRVCVDGPVFEAREVFFELFQ